MLRHRADLKTLAYMFVTTSLLLWQWNRDEFSVPLFIAAMLMAVSVSVISHNHNHLRIWKAKWLNAATDYWITCFYGFPTFAWIPTHNANHHKFNNREGDYTITYRVSEKNNLFTLLSYPTISSYWQQRPIRDFLKHNYRNNRKRFWYSMSQYAVLVAFIGTALLIDWKKALLYVVAPQQFSLFVVLVFNYIQHVHCDEESEWNHSRNNVGWAMNAFLFNNGYHTIHHMKPGLHWSQTKAAHQEIAHHIDPSLQDKSFWWMLLSTYVLGPIFPKLGSKSMRLARIERERADQAGGPEGRAAAA